MPAVSKSQQRLMGAAEHGADFPLAEKLRTTMSHDQLHDFAVGSMAAKPEHAGPPMLAGSAPGIISSNTTTLKGRGLSEIDATKAAIKHPNRHKNLGKHLIPRKDGQPHGSPKLPPLPDKNAF